MRKITIDCSSIANKQQLHEALKEALLLPEWYGHNLDALFDCLTELEEETFLIVTGWTETDYSSGFESVFTDAAAENILFSYRID